MLQGACWRHLFRDVWVHRDVEDTRELRFAAVRHVLTPNAVCNMHTAAWLYGADVRKLGDLDVHVGYPQGKRQRARTGMVVCQETLAVGDICAVDGVALTSPTRTVFDCLRFLRSAEGLVVADAMTHEALTSVDAVASYFDARHRLRNLRIGQRLVPLIEPKAESAMETRMRWRMVAGGLPPPEAQIEVYDPFDGFVGRLDTGYREAKTAAEYDGAAHWEQRRHDDRRRAALRALGWDVLVFSAADVYSPDDVIAETVRRSLWRHRSGWVGDRRTLAHMPVQSVFPLLEPVLPRVRKPVQYVGGELHAVVKDWDSCEVRWALMYPDAYEVGQPNQGVQILYEVLNEQDGVLAERTYSVWPDLEAVMREQGIPQFTVDGHRPVAAFDLLGVSFSTELGYTNLLTALDLAGIPLATSDRGDGHPVVIAGGHAAFNPEPIAEFIDAAVLGDGEQAALTISGIVRDWKTGGRPGGRDGLLLRLASTGVAYVPRFYDVSYLPDGRIQRVVPNRTGVPWRVAKHTVMDLDAWPYPKRPLVPLAETVHERYSVEIFRGCTRGCRFCQAGMITRPVRERSITTVGEMVQRGIEATGFEEVGLLSLSSADHSEIGAIAKGLADRYDGEQVSLSLPSTRVDAFNVSLAEELSRNGRRTGLTFAPEGGSERMRRVINKMVTEDDLIRTVTTAYGSGWRQVKLYFMCGLPAETDADVLQIADLARRVIEAGRASADRRDIRCTVSIGAFVPKPHTPFQWAAQLDHETVDRRLRALRDAIGADRNFRRAIGLRYHDGRPSIIEGLLSRGDRRVAAVIRRVWEDGQRFDGWSEYFSFDRWVAACEAGFAGTPVSLDWFTTRERTQSEVLPWDHLDAGLDKDWLWEDWQAALDAGSADGGAVDEVEDCRWTPCYDCGVCPSMGTETQIGPTGRALLPLTPA